MERQTFRFYPSDRQERQFAREFGCARYAYNFALQLRTDSFAEGEKINYNASSAKWTEHRKNPAFAWLKRCSSVPQQQALRHLQTAYSNFFAKRTKFPRFKSKHGKQRVGYTASAFKWDAENRNLSISKIGRLRINWSREFTSPPSTVTITKYRSGKYFVSLCLDEPAKIALPKTGKQVGVDLGISYLATLSDGTVVPNPRHTLKDAKRLSWAQKTLARKTKGSNRYHHQRIRVAKIHDKIADSRKDTLDKLTTHLVREYDVIAIEHLHPRGMVRNHNLAKHISCASFGQFRQMLEYKADWYGKEVRVANRFFPSSKRCSCCGHIHKEMPLRIREFDCENCGEHLKRDPNASMNILLFAKTISVTTGGQPESQARGECVRRPSASAGWRYVLRNVNQPSSTND